MSKKIKKRTKKKDDPELVEGVDAAAEPEADLKIEDYVDANDPAMEFGDPSTWEDAGEDKIEVAPLPVDEDGQVDQAALEAQQQGLTTTDQLDMASARVADFVEKNIRLIAALIVLAALAPVVYAVGQSVVESSRLSDAERVAGVFKLYMRPVEHSPELQFFEFNKDFTRPDPHATQQAKWDAIYKEAEAAQAKNPGQAVYTAKLARAAAALRLERWDEAVTLYTELSTSAPSAAMRPFAQLGLAQALSGKGELDKAVEAYEALGKLDAKYEPLVQYQRALHLERAGKAKEAKEALHKLIELHPDTSYKADVERRLALM